MVSFTVNGVKHQTDKSINLLEYLRKDLQITSAKDGCSAGACGTCTVLVDGKKTKACLVKMHTLQDKAIITVEGLSKREQDVYAYAFGKAGAVQCGFCIPGMVMSAKSLLDENLEPSREDIKKAIMGNICRCTGYVKIEDAILLAASMLKDNTPIPEETSTAKMGEHFIRIDAREKTLGTGIYVDDMHIDGMVYAKALRTKYPRAKIHKINIEPALKHPDVIRILTAKDVPFNKTGHIVPDWDVMIAEGDITRYIGDALALVATHKEESLDAVLALIEVEYEELAVMDTPQKSLEANAPLLHPNGNVVSRQHIVRGDVDKAFAEADHVVTHKYSVPMTDHAFMEPECAIAMPMGEDGVLLYTGSQSVYDEQHEIARMLQIPEEKVRSQSQLVGGGFGGKEDMSVQHHAALMAYLIKKPVKVKFSRQESLEIHTKRHAMEMEFTTSCTKDGIITGLRAHIISDCGAYASLAGPVLQRACTHAAGPYNYQNIDVSGESVYTNNVPGGAFRGFGVTQSCFAMEQNINAMATLCGIDPWEMRYRNAIRPGQELPNGQIASEDTAFVECLEAVKDEFYRWPFAGIAGAMKNSGIGVGLPDIGRCHLLIKEGKVHVQTSAACIGQGLATVCVTMICQTIDIDPRLIIVEKPDTAVTPNSGTTTASRQTLFTGEATRQAAIQLGQALKTQSLAELEGRLFIGEYSGVTDKFGSDLPNPKSHIAYGYGVQVVIVDESKKVTKVIAAHDVGRVVNPDALTGQIEGGVVMGLGYAFTENFVQESGYVKTKYGTLGLLRATQVPEIEVILVEKADKNGLAYGAKGIGEICAVPTAPAAALACQRVDGMLRTSLPMQQTGYRK
ncbi:selenium-dependent xanthine dehydrogenase (plasmid) [Entomospira entomophila]|uniref:Selenium-dependent xanthine dehydrogenase n=1 Tax=Entomospira entomophila TaxID=2719988 RepID=A0A968GD03_9SPIO|nr:selenium-dependent xanthine dehydrogenase [Entomospira entomophilus]NIZ41333.1 selenium-dependent xanthine dehydrogenase [Entomospira entomophilus]WDI36256.1 selenium-dependent xanthine dehydrogenase [Entomospira entomophilus]